MINRFKKNIIILLNLLHEARKEPHKNNQVWLTLQEALLKKLIFVENRIRFCKKESKKLNQKRNNSSQRLSKEDSLSIKSKLKMLDYKIEEYKSVILILKSIGDGIAFTFINKYDIKPQNFKESPGFISEKIGLILEKKIMRYAFKMGQIAILNDLTSVLKYADITIITNLGIFYLEAKSSKTYNARISRQSEKAKKLFTYLSEDITTNLYEDETGECIRVDLERDEINYMESFNNLILSAKKKGFDFALFEEGFLCLIEYESRDIHLEEILKKSSILHPLFFHLNLFQFSNQGYYPFSLLFTNPTEYWEFLEGHINIIVVIDLLTIENIALKKGYTVNQDLKENMAFTFKSMNADAELTELDLSEHFFYRIIMEMVSVKWLIQSSFDLFKSKLKNQADDDTCI